MDTDKWEILVTLSKTESVRKTAELSRRTPSAISKIIRQLEEEAHASFVVPSGRGIALTDAARHWVKQVQPILSAVHDLRRRGAAHDRRREAKPLRLAAFEVFSTYFLKTLDSTPDFDRGLVLHEVIPGELERAVDEGKADFGITYLPIPHPRLEHVKVTRALMGVFKRKGSYEGTPQENLPYVVPVSPLSGTPTQVRGLDGWPAEAYDRKVKYEVTLMESALELCRQGRCAGYFPEFVIHLHNRQHRTQYHLVRHPWERTAVRCYTDVYLVRKKSAAEDRDFNRLAKWIRMATRAPAIQA